MPSPVDRHSSASAVESEPRQKQAIALDAAVAGRIEALLSTTDPHFEIAGRDTGMDLGCLLTIVIEPT